jgi:hypothetical protein
MRHFIGFLLILCFAIVSPVFAMDSTNYQINWDSVNSGGDDSSSSTNYRMRDTVGEQGTGFSSSTLYRLSAGYRVGDQDENSLTFSLGTQENVTKTSYTSFSSSTKEVTVSSVASFSIGDLIGVVENEGLNQQAVVGRIFSINGLIIGVDQWDGATGTVSGTPAGGDDFVYRLNGNLAELGILSPLVGKTSITATTVSSNALNGYVVNVSDDGDLRYGTSTFIANVADGTVTLGAEEYGAQVFGAVATSTGSDFGFSSTTQRDIQERATTTLLDRVALVYKASISSATAAGNYSHVVYYRVTARY